MKGGGYVDLQINGCIGVDFSDPKLTEAMFMRAAEHIFADGTELFLPTLVTSPPELYFRNLPLIREACEKHGILERVPGVHLEGPFISPEPGAVGAHRPRDVREPDPALLEEIVERSGGYVKLLTVAAERPRAAELIARARALGIAVSCGHQLAGTEDLQQAVRAGARLLTHLGNGCPNLIDRHRNPIWAGMSCDELTAMIITDGHHLPPELIRCIFRTKGADRIIVTSDAAPVAGLPPGRYNIWGNDAVLEPNGRYHNPVKGCLVGSSASMRECADCFRSLGIASEEEIDRMTRINPLEMIRRAGAGGTRRAERGRGGFRTGKRGDER